MTPDRTARLAPLAALLLAAIPWISALDAAFVYDDTNVVRRARLEGRSLAETLGTRRPAVELTLDLNHAIGGLEPSGYHLLNVLLHLAAVALVFGVVKRTLARVEDPWPARAASVAFAVALTWGVHPLHTESVTYVVQRAEVMAGLGVLGALYALARATTSSRPMRWEVVAVLACLMAMASKASAAAAPLILMAWEQAFGARGVRAALRARPVLHLGCLGSLGVLVLVGVVGGVLGLGGARGTVGFTSAVDWADYAVSQPGVILEYLRLVFVPRPLCIDRAWPVGVSAAGSLVVAALLLITARGVLRRAPYGFAGALFFLALAPTSSFVPVDDLFYEHRMYLALLAPAGVVACAASHLGRRPLLIGALVAAGVLAALTWSRNLDYHDPVRLFRQTLRTSPDNLRARLNLAVALRDSGEVEAAMAELRRIVEADAPGDIRRPHAAWHMARIHRERGDDRAALAAYRAAVSGLPGDAAVRFDLATALLDAGMAEEGLEQLEQVESLRPGHRGAVLERAHALLLLGDVDEAGRQVEAVVVRHPGWARAHELLGIVRRRQGRLGDAVAAYRKSVGLRDDRHQAWFNMSIAASLDGDDDLAFEAAARAAELAPSNPRYAYQVAAFHRRAGRLEDALAWLRRADDLGVARHGVPVEDDLRELEALIEKGN